MTGRRRSRRRAQRGLAGRCMRLRSVEADRQWWLFCRLPTRRGQAVTRAGPPQFEHDAGEYRASNGGGLGLTQALEDLPLPTIAVVSGLCLTWGLELSLACDLLLASSD